MFSLDDYNGGKEDPIITDFFRRDYRAFLVGEEWVASNGTYFKGRRFFDLDQRFEKLEIVGEYYKDDKTRTTNKVMKTPYIFIRVSEESYNIFISPYTDPDTGETFEYTQIEFFSIVENILNFFLYDGLRTTSVRVVIIVAPQLLSDPGVIQDTLDETFNVTPYETEDILVGQDTEYGELQTQPEVGVTYVCGGPVHSLSKEMALSPIDVQADTNDPIMHCSATTFNFITPHEQAFSFGLVILGERTLEAPLTGGNVDVTSSQHYPIVIRNPSNVDSPNAPPGTIPGNAYTLAVGNEISGWATDTMVDFDFVNETYQADEVTKTFIYDVDLMVYGKSSNLQTDYSLVATNPTAGSLNTLTDLNTILFLFNEPFPYDYVIDVEYLPQPTWENRY